VRVALLGIVAVVALAGCGGAKQAAPRATLHEVRTVADMRRVFNADAGRRRLFVLFSPT
jgi:hypothetical protein